MKIEYALFASFAVYMPDRKPGKAGFTEMEEGASVKKLFQQLGLPENQVKIAFVNGRRVEEDAPLKDGDRVGIFPLVAGG